MTDRQHTAECYRDGCKVGAHPSPRPGHVTGGPWTPEEVLAGKHLPVTAAVPDPVTDVWELLHTAACDYRDQAGSQRSEARLIDALMPIVTAYGDALRVGYTDIAEETP